MRKKLIAFVGWYGAAAILLAYALVSFNAIKAHSLAYQSLNLTGSVGIAVISIQKRATQAAFLNIIWALIALVGIMSILIR